MEKSRILVVNDAQAVCVLITLILNRQGFEIIVAENGVEALKKLNELHFDLIITDLNMPEMDGYELTKIVRSHEKYRFIPIIFITGGDRSAIYHKAKEAGSTAFISLPFEKEKLIKIVRTFIR